MSDYDFIKDTNGNIAGIWVKTEALANKGMICALLAKHGIDGPFEKAIMDDLLEKAISGEFTVKPNTLDNNGGYFILFRSQNNESVPMTRKLNIGMAIEEVVDLLGQPTARMDGDRFLGKFEVVAVSKEGLSSIKKMEFCLWKRPEGDYNLAFLAGKLTKIHSVPK